jgi:hypothetical protein
MSTEPVHNAPPQTPHPLKLWDRTVKRKLRTVVRGQAFKHGEWIGVVVAHDVDAGGVAVKYDDGREALLSPNTDVFIPYGVAVLA